MTRIRPAHPTARRHRGLTLTELTLGLVAAAMLVALILPSLARAGGERWVTSSLTNLRTLGIAHAIYAADFNGRQLTYCPDDIAAFGDSAAEAFNAYENQTSTEIPALRLGWGQISGGGPYLLFSYDLSFSSANSIFYTPISFDAAPASFLRVGGFRMPNATPFNQYLSGRFYDATFYADSDPVVWPLVEPATLSPDEYVDRPPVIFYGDLPLWSSYSMSAAAMLNPLTVTAQRDEGAGPAGGWSDPWQLDDGFASPGLFQARYANLKTLMIEHHWLQNAPEDPCNPAFELPTYDGCEPYFFNHGIDSAPASLFYDLSTRILPNTEAVAADDQLRVASGGFDGTWLRTTPFGEDGYFSEVAFDMTRVSHHVLTADGILGRDTVEGAGGSMDGDRYAELRRPRRALGRTAPARTKHVGTPLSNHSAP